jgi:hypothetical protein
MDGVVLCQTVKCLVRRTFPRDLGFLHAPSLWFALDKRIQLEILDGSDLMFSPAVKLLLRDALRIWKSRIESCSLGSLVRRHFGRSSYTPFDYWSALRRGVGPEVPGHRALISGTVQP